MNFLHPWLLAGAAVMAVPIALHLFGRRQAPELRFSAFEFLMTVNQRLALWEKLRRIALLLARIAVIALAALALARPVVQGLAPAALASAPVAWVIDRSASMAYRLDDVTLFERAVQRVRQGLTSAGASQAMTVIDAGPTPRSLVRQLSVDHAELRRALTGLSAPEGHFDLAASIDLAAVQLDAAQVVGEIVVVTDLTKAALGDPPRSAVGKHHVRYLDAAERSDPLESLPNVAIVGVVPQAVARAPQERQFQIKVHNYGSQALENVQVEMRINGDPAMQSIAVALPAQSTTTSVMTATFATPGLYTCTFALKADAFPSDDSFVSHVRIEAPVHVLAVNGEPRQLLRSDELYFIQKALANRPGSDAAIRMTSVGVDNFHTGMDFNDVDVILLANVDHITPPMMAALHEHHRRGRGVLFAMGPRVSFETANESFGDLLPYPLRDRYRAEGASLGMQVVNEAMRHPMLKDLDAATLGGLTATRTAAYFNVDPASSERADVLLQFSNGATALAELRRRSETEGRVFLWTSTLDIDDTDIPLSPVFPLLMQRMVRYLAHGVADPNAVEPVVNPSHQESNFAPVNLRSPDETVSTPHVLMSGVVDAEGSQNRFVWLVAAVMMLVILETALAVRG